MMQLVVAADRLEDLTAAINTAKAAVTAFRIDARPIDGPFGVEWEIDLYVDYPEGPRAA